MSTTDTSYDSVFSHYDQLEKLPGIVRENVSGLTKLEVPIVDSYLDFHSKGSGIRIAFTDYFRVWTRVEMLLYFFLRASGYHVATKITKRTIVSLELEEQASTLFQFSDQMIKSTVEKYFEDTFSRFLQLSEEERRVKIRNVFSSKHVGKFIFSLLGTKQIQFSGINDESSGLSFPKVLYRLLSGGGTCRSENLDSFQQFNLTNRVKLKYRIRRFGLSLKQDGGSKLWRLLLRNADKNHSSYHYVGMHTPQIFCGDLSISSMNRANCLSNWIEHYNLTNCQSRSQTESDQDQMALMMLQGTFSIYPFVSYSEKSLNDYAFLIIDRTVKYEEESSELGDSDNSPIEDDDEYILAHQHLAQIFKKRGKKIQRKFVSQMLSVCEVM